MRKTFSTCDNILLFSSRIVLTYLRIFLGFFETFGFVIASNAKLIVAIGVLNSCDMLFIKSVLISDIFF